jgi:hypothetical protein
MFDPALAGYWGSDDVSVATETFLSLIREHADKVDGVKVSLLDASHEVALRAALPGGRPPLHRRRLQLPGTDRRRPNPPLGRPAGHLRCHLPGRFGCACRSTTPAKAPKGAPSWTPPVSSESTSSAPPRSTTRPGSRSCPGSTASSPVSRWWAACTRAVPCCTWRRPSNWPTRPAC